MSSSSNYSPEETGRLLADFLRLQARLRRRLTPLPTLVDLDSAIRPLSPRLKRVVRRFIISAHTPALEMDTFPLTRDLEAAITGLEEEDRMREARLLRSTLRDIRVLNQITERLNTISVERRFRTPILIRAGHRQAGSMCRNCNDRIELGEQVLWDRDRGRCWHAVCSYLDSLSSAP